jgi:hypothetical protein
MTMEELNQLMLEKQQQVEVALLDLESGHATQEQIDLIWSECGLSERRKQLKRSCYEYHCQ